MRVFRQRLRICCATDDGPTAVEYAVLLMLITGICIAVVRAQGRSASAAIGSVNSEMNLAATSGSSCGTIGSGGSTTDSGSSSGTSGSSSGTSGSSGSSSGQSQGGGEEVGEEAEKAGVGDSTVAKRIGSHLTRDRPSRRIR